MRISVGRIELVRDDTGFSMARCSLTHCHVAQRFRLPPTETGYPAELVYAHPFMAGILSAAAIVDHWLVVLRALVDRRTDPRSTAARFVYERLDRAYRIIAALKPTHSPCALLEAPEENAFTLRHGDTPSYFFAPESDR